MRKVFLLLMLFAFSFEVSSQLLINEFLSSNSNGLLDEDNEYSDWIELFNNGSDALDITGYALSDDISLPAKWTLPQLSLPGNSHLFVFASGKDRKLLALTYQTIIDMDDEWRYLVPTSDIGASWHESGFDDSMWSLGSSGFGYGDDDDSTVVDTSISVFIRKEFSVSNISDISRLILCADYDDGFVAYINGHEVARANLGNSGEVIPFDRLCSIDHEALMYNGGSPVYFEITNPGSVLVEGTNIIAIQVHNNSTTSSDLTMIPFLTIGRFSLGVDDISPFLSFPEDENLHTNFKLDADGESFYLFNASGTLIDSSGAVSLLSDISYGRKPDGSADWYYFSEPTPGAPNNTNGVEEYLASPVTFSPVGGKHLGGVTVVLSSLISSDTIFYTTDGSIPGKDDQRYTSPINVDSSQVIRARVIKYTALPGPVGTNTYMITHDHDLPIVCLSTDPGNLWDSLYGIFAMGPNAEPSEPHFGANFWQDWERPVHFELYDVEGVKRIDQGAGMKVFGGWSRSNDQKSVALFARKEYGEGSFEYKIFADKPIEKFESIILRNSGNDNMMLQFHDCFMTGLTRNMNIDRQAFQPAAVYINGTYWGLLNIREKVNTNYIEENHHVDADSVNLLENNGSIIDGTNEDYLEIISYLNTHSTLQNYDDYFWVEDKIDLDNFIQYQLTQIYLNNRDWPGNNIKFWNTTNPDSKWRWIIYDTDFGYGLWSVSDYTLNTLEFALYAYSNDWPNPAWSTLFLRRMVSNLGFRNYFINQFCDRLNLDFHPVRIYTDLDSLQELYDQEMIFTFNRWWGSYDDWLQRITNHKTFGFYRPNYCRKHMKDVFGLDETLEITLDVSDSHAGSIKINTIYPNTYPFTGIYFKNITIKLTAVPRPGYKFVRWEGAINSTNLSIWYDMSAAGTFKAVFEEAGIDDISIVINEINYNSSPDRDTKDWVELVNNGLATVDLNGWLLSDSGPDSGYFFTEGMTLVPNQYLVICRDLEAFHGFNPAITNAVGDMPFGLSSTGDILRLYDSQSNLMDAVDYYIYNPWPTNANGTGASIELKDPSLDNTRGENWQAIGVGGTPGKPNNGVLSIADPKLPEFLTAGFSCFPNPFRDYTTIEFSVVAEGHYRLEIIDINGRVVNLLADDYLAQGSYWIDWDGSDQNNEMLNEGVYIVRLYNEKNVQTLKILMLK